MALIRPDLSGRIPQIGEDRRRSVIDNEDREEVVALKNEMPNKMVVECHEGETLDIFIFPDNGSGTPMNILLKVDTLVRIIKRRNGINPDPDAPKTVQVGDGLTDKAGEVVILITEDELFPRQ